MRTLLHNMNRKTLGQVLMLAGVIAVAGAALLDRLGIGAGSLPFVGTLVCLKLGLFTFWPELIELDRKRRRVVGDIFRLGAAEDPDRLLREEKDLFVLNQKAKKPSSLSLWDQNDPRLDVSLFSGTVPTFVLNAEQRFLDWNPAFDLVFGDLADVKRGGHVSHWFHHLDNFRRVPKRTDRLYGEGVLPITDRERVTFLSKTWGRMVFTKIMTPIVDRGTGRIIGWTVVLNINSVNKRQEFFERLFADIALETKRIRYAASYDGLFDGFAGHEDLVAAHLANVDRAYRVLDFGAGTGCFTKAMLADGRKVTALEGDLHLLRRAKDRCEGFETRVRLVRQDLDHLKNMPTARYDAAVMAGSLHRLADPVVALREVFKSLKPGATLSLSARIDGVEPLFAAVRTHLEASGRYDNLKHQFSHVLEFERELARAGVLKFPTREEVRVMVLEAGFMIESETRGLCGGHVLLLKARR